MSTASTIPGEVGAVQQTAPAQQLNRSCESCRSLKVRCLPDSTSSNQCQRCAKAKRACIFVAPQRRRPRKRTDSRVAQLEREMRQMRSLLKDRIPVDESSEDSSGSEIEDSAESEIKTDLKERLSAIPEAQSSTSGSTRHFDLPSPSFPLPRPPPPFPNTTDTGYLSTHAAAESSSNMTVEDDVVERGLVTLEYAETLVAFFLAELMEFSPLIFLPSNTTASGMRRSKPVLFLSVIAAAAMSVDNHLAAILNRELLRVYADRFFINGDKSLELIQAVLLMVIFYYPPDSPLKLQCYQYTHIAATMALEIGLSSRKISRSGSNKPGIYDENMAQQARALLGCYHLASAVAMKTRRPNILVWNSWMDECTKHLDNSPNAADRQMATWFELQKIIDEALAPLGLDDTSVTTPLTDMRVQTILRWFDDRMRSWRKRLSPEMLHVPMAFEYHYANLSMYELAVGEGYRDPEALKQPYYALPVPDRGAQHQRESPSAARIDIIVKWMNAAHEMLDLFLSCDTGLLRKIPSIIYARVGVAMMSLLKIYFSVSAGALGEAVTPETVKAGLYLDAMSKKLSEASGEKEYRVPSKWFYIIAVKGRTWYEQFEEKTDKDEGRGRQATTSTPVNYSPGVIRHPQSFGPGEQSSVGISADVSQIPNFHPMPGGFGAAAPMAPVWQAAGHASPGSQNYLNVQPMAGYQPPMLPSYGYGPPQVSPGESQRPKPMPPTSNMGVEGWIPDGTLYGMPGFSGY